MDYMVRFQRFNFKIQQNNKILLIVFYNSLKNYFKDNLIKLKTLFISLNKIIWVIIQINNYIYKRKLKKINKQSLFFNYKKNIEVSRPRKSYYKSI